MTTIPEFIECRKVAGARFALAVDELREAIIDLYAYDIASANGGVAVPGSARATGTFGKDIDRVRDALSHPDFLDPLGLSWSEAARQRAEQIVRRVR